MADKKQVQSRIFLGLYALLFLGLVVFVVFQLRQNKLGNIIEDGNILSILVTVYQEDTPILNEVVFLSAESGKAAILDIPTNSGSLIESKALIAGLDVLFDPRDPQAYIEQINQFTGYPIQFHMFFDLAGQKSFIDILGGIEVFVSDAQEYIQPENIIMLPAGSVRLDGDKSQSFLSFSTPEESSADRVSRYQRWVQAIFQGIGDQEELLSFPEVQSLLRETLQTNIDELSFQSLISTLATSDLEQVIYMRLLGEERMVDNQRLIFPYDEGVPLRNGVMETFESLKNTRSVEGEDLAIKVEILNGTDQKGLAARTKVLFENNGFEVIRVGNAPESGIEETEILDVQGNFSLAGRVGEFIRSRKISTQLDFPHREETEIVVILGGDFDGRYAGN